MDVDDTGAEFHVSVSTKRGGRITQPELTGVLRDFFETPHGLETSWGTVRRDVLHIYRRLTGRTPTLVN